MKITVEHCRECNGRGMLEESPCENPGCLVEHGKTTYKTCLNCEGTGHIVSTK